MVYAIEIKRSARRELERLPAKSRRQVASAINGLAMDPRPRGAIKLTDRGGEYRLRSGNYRIIYMIFDDRLVVMVIAVDDRKDVYRRR
jgi:mRNA interferase RelE/StbE